MVKRKRDRTSENIQQIRRMQIVSPAVELAIELRSEFEHNSHEARFNEYLKPKMARAGYEFIGSRCPEKLVPEDQRFGFEFDGLFRHSSGRLVPSENLLWTPGDAASAKHIVEKVEKYYSYIAGICVATMGRCRNFEEIMYSLVKEGIYVDIYNVLPRPHTKGKFTYQLSSQG